MASLDDEMRQADEAAAVAQEAAAEAEDNVAAAKRDKRRGKARRHGRERWDDERRAALAQEAKAESKAPDASKPQGPSLFAEIRAELKDTAEVNPAECALRIATRIRAGLLQPTRSSTAPKSSADQKKGLRLLLQAMSNLPSDAPYTAFFDAHRAEALWLLDYAVNAGLGGGPKASGGRPTPGTQTRSAPRMHQDDISTLDFVDRARRSILCTQAYDDYIADVRPLTRPTGAKGEEDQEVPFPVLSPKELVQDLAEKHPEAFLRRQVQRAANAAQLVDCVADVEAAMSPPTNGTSGLKPQSATLVVSQLLSKVRQVFSGIGTPDEADADEGAEPTAEEVGAAPPKKPSDGRKKKSAVTPLSETELAAAKREAVPVVEGILKLACGVLCSDPPKATPPSRLQHWLDWVASNELVEDVEGLGRLETLLTQITQSTAAAADGMTAVLALKAANTRGELRDALRDVTRKPTIQPEGDDEEDDATSPVAELGAKRARPGPTSARLVLTQTTPDVLSALGVAGATLRTALTKQATEDAEGEELCADIAEALRSFSGTLPRRAQRFLDGEVQLRRKRDPTRPQLQLEVTAPEEPPQPAAE